MTSTTTPTTAIPCPTWCTIDHVAFPGAGFFHAGADLGDTPRARMRLWQQDAPGAMVGVVFAGELLSEAATRELGHALVRAADALSRTR